MTDSADLTGVAGWAVDLMDRLGPVGAGLGIAAENLFPPLPSEVILPLAGFTASTGSFTLVEAIAWTTAGSVVGAWILYAVGRLVGRDRFYRLWSRIPLAKVEELAATERWFERHGRKAVLLGRFLPIFRSLISIPAGLTAMPLPAFTLLTLIGSAIWNSIFIVAGYKLGEHWERVEPIVGWLQWAVLVAVAALVVTWAWRRMTAVRRRARSQGSGAKTT